MIQRHLGGVLKRAAKSYPVLTLTGPRQSGKTTLARATFPKHAYVSLELPDEREFAREDPRGFLAQHAGPVVLDEVQRAPDLFSYIQVLSDERPEPGRFVLSGSQNFLLLDRVSQSLAGRAALSYLLPLTQSELSRRSPFDPEGIGATRPRTKPTGGDLFEVMLRGGYPRIHDQNLDPQQWLAGYFQTYLERDVREVTQVGELETFGRFVRLCAGRAGQLLSLNSLANDCAISRDTARRWLSVLEASFAVFLLRPHFKNFNKRLVKSPKLYFIDTGLLCFLLRIRSAAELHTHSMRGAVFENFTIVELLKNYYNRGRLPDLYFWRDHRGNEIDLIVDCGEKLIPVEIKSGRTVVDDFFRGLRYWQRIAGKPSQSALVYGGDTSQVRHGTAVYSWRQWA